jgi:hypothetical protein
MFKPTLPELIGEVLGFLFIVGLLGWALVSFFPVTWGQALVISWMFTKLLDVLRSIGR